MPWQPVTRRFCLCLHQVRDFFGSPDALHAAFWPQQQQLQKNAEGQPDSNGQVSQANNSTATASGSPAGLSHSSQASPAANNHGNGGTNSSSSSNGMDGPQQQQQQQHREQQEPWLQLDQAAVNELHRRLQSCHDDKVKDACCSGSEKLLLHISVCAKQHKPNPGFCRQVSSRDRCKATGGCHAAAGTQSIGRIASQVQVLCSTEQAVLIWLRVTFCAVQGVVPTCCQAKMCAWLLHVGLVQVSALFANPWLEHIEYHELLAGLAGVLVELQQHEGASTSSSSSDGSSTHFNRQLQQLFLTWRTEEMRRWAWDSGWFLDPSACAGVTGAAEGTSQRLQQLPYVEPVWCCANFAAVWFACTKDASKLWCMTQPCCLLGTAAATITACVALMMLCEFLYVVCHCTASGLWVCCSSTSHSHSTTSRR